VLFVVFVSLGEAIWSPRWYDYSMSVAPEVRCLSPAVVPSCGWMSLIEPDVCWLSVMQ